MKPIILYAPNTTNFNNNGLGVLDEAISAIVTEERNGIYELVITYPITGKRFDDIAYSCIIRCLTIPNGLYQTFRIYAISKPINGIITINAEHVSYQLSYIIADAFTATSCAEAMVKIKQKAMSDCPFDFWTDKSVTANYTQDVPENIRARLAGVSGSILDVYGGEYEFDNYTVKLWGQRGADRGVTLRYGKNITDIEQEENISNVYTSIVGYWKSEEGVVKTGVIDCQYASAYPFKRTVSVDFSSEFQEQPTVEQLEAKATSYMTSNNFGVPKVSIKTSFAALHQFEEYKNLAIFERVYLCDTVTVYFEKLGINAQAKVVKTTYNVLLDRYDSIELGEARTNLAGRLASDIGNVDRKLEETKSDLQKAMERSAQLITGNKGGHVILVRDANGKPQEICIMDTEDITTATKVWRWNLSGLGYSNAGYTPSVMPLAMTMEGAINAQFITTGILNAQIIKAGIIADKVNDGHGGYTSYNYWNLETGEFLLSPNAKVGNSYASGKTITKIADDAVDNYDNNLKQQQVFDKLFKKSDGSYIQGISLTSSNLYISASVINTGTLGIGGTGSTPPLIQVKNTSGAEIGKWDSSGIDVKAGSIKGTNIVAGGANNNDGTIVIKNGSGAEIGRWDNSGLDVKSGTITGAKVQTASSGPRMEMNNTSTLEGKNDNGTYNRINMMQGNTTQMSIDAATQLNIRAETLYVVKGHGGTSTMTVYKTKTTDTSAGNTEWSDDAVCGQRPCYRITNVYKEMAGTPTYDSSWNVRQIDFPQSDGTTVQAMLPVLLRLMYVKEKKIHGMIIEDGETADSYMA